MWIINYGKNIRKNCGFRKSEKEQRNYESSNRLLGLFVRPLRDGKIYEPLCTV